MNAQQLFGLSGVAAIAGGVLRIFAAVAQLGDQVTLVWLYTVIDVLLLMGLMGIYLSRAERLGYLGLASFGVAVAALSFIGGPDADVFGFSTYEEGATALAIAMVGLSIAWLQRGERPIWAPLCWFGSVVCVGLLNFIPPLTQYGFMLAGILFGLGFALAGLVLLRRRA